MHPTKAGSGGMRPNRLAADIGIVICLLSFALRVEAGIPGWWCAAASLVIPFREDWQWLSEKHSLAGIAIFAGGLVNPLLIIDFFLLWKAENTLFARILRAVIVLILPLSALVFYWEEWTPLEAYCMWSCGILLIPFSFRKNRCWDFTLKPGSDARV